MKGKRFILKDKLFFSLHGGVKKLEGNAVSVAKSLKGIELLHIIDEDLLRFPRVVKNLDVYDKLTYFIHVQVEVPDGATESVLRSLLERNVRIVLSENLAERFEEMLKAKAGFVVAKGFVKDWICDVFFEECPSQMPMGKRIFALSPCPTAFCEIEG